MALNYYITDSWLVDFSYSWFDFEVKEQRSSATSSCRTRPENKYSVGLAYNGDRFGGSVKYRWVDDFPWAAGVFVGDVPSYDLVDLGVNYDINDNLAGRRRRQQPARRGALPDLRRRPASPAAPWATWRSAGRAPDVKYLPAGPPFARERGPGFDTPPQRDLHSRLRVFVGA